MTDKTFMLCFTSVMIDGVDYVFIPKNEFFTLAEDDAHIVLRRKVCPPPSQK